MPSRLEELNYLVTLRLRAGSNHTLDDPYQIALQETRPNVEEFEYIDREVTLRRAKGRPSGTTPPPGDIPAC